MNTLATITEGYSGTVLHFQISTFLGSELKEMCREAAMISVSEFIRSKSPTEIRNLTDQVTLMYVSIKTRKLK
jgi:SpoVK/Ycf46/Vps4 family AAA+-type ATPase